MNNYTIGQKLHKTKTDRSNFFVKEIYDRSIVTQNQNRSIKLFCKRNLRSVNVTQKTPPNLIDRCITLKDKAIDRFLWLIVKINLYIYKKKKKKKKKKKNLIYLFLKTILSSTITQKLNFGIQMNISTDFATFLFLFLFIFLLRSSYYILIGQVYKQSYSLNNIS
jgi:hypothetical protein